MIDDALAAGHLREVLVSHAAPAPPVHAVYLPERRRDPRIRAFVEFLKVTGREVPSSRSS